MLQGSFGLGLNTGVNLGVASNLTAHGAHNMNLGTQNQQEGAISYNHGMMGNNLGCQQEQKSQVEIAQSNFAQGMKEINANSQEMMQASNDMKMNLKNQIYGKAQMIQGATEFNSGAQMASNVGLGLSGNAGFGYQGY